MLMGQVVTALMHRAIDLGHKKLPGLLALTEDDIVEKHSRVHTVPVTPAHARGAVPGSACDCVIAHAVADLPEVYAAIIMRSRTYLLEKDERGRLKVFRYKSPDQARRLTINFDRRLKTKRIVMKLTPPARSQSLAAQRHYQKKMARRVRAGKPAQHPGPKFNPLSYTRTLVPDRLLVPFRGR